MEAGKLVFEAIGTRWEIQLEPKLGAKALATLSKQLQCRTEAFDKAYSRFRTDSLVSAIARKPGVYALPADGFLVLRFYEQLYRATDGLVTPLIGQVMADAGYDADYSFKPRPLMRPPAWESVVAYDRQHIEVKRPALLDFGAAGKGYLADILGEIVREAGVQSFVINAGGDMLHRAADGRGIEIGLENPLDTSEVIGVTTLRNQSLCASSISKRKWRGFHHILNPSTLQPADGVIATWVIAGDTMTTDGIATALFFTPAQVLAEKFSFSYAVLRKDMSLSCSQDFPLRTFEAAHE